MHDNAAIEEGRITRFRRRLEPLAWRATHPLSLESWEVTGEPVPFAHAIEQEFRPVTLPHAWGPAWCTEWFHVHGTVPADWYGPDGHLDDGVALEAVVDLGFTDDRPGFQCEGLVFAMTGDVVKGVAPRSAYTPVAPGADGTVEFMVEAAANPDVAGDWTFEKPNHPSRRDDGGPDLYTVRRADLVLRDIAVWELIQDMRVLDGLMRELPVSSPRRHLIRAALMKAIDVFTPEHASADAARARAELAPVLASPANASAHRIVAVGNAHIDSAWLWPTRETIRKCARTFSNVLALMDDDPTLVFAVSSAQQLQWVKDHYPDVFARIRERVAEGRFVPVGGMWVEPDMNLPSGESLVRQFVFGKRFFLAEFGVETKEAWVPDTFGYSAAVPQIVKASASDWLLTQKISWNQTNRMPHHTFLWEGIDGTALLTHFPPADTYVGELNADDLARAERQHRDHSLASVSIIPFGFGDGGGGPTREMLASAARTADLEGSPRVTVGSPQSFFDEVQVAIADSPDVAVWTGELYLELHRGTYTTQQPIKRGNRRSEVLLREAEMWSATATVRTGLVYPAARIDAVWRRVLLNQFHDILPGTSITWVHREAVQAYEEVERELDEIIGEALTALAGEGDRVLAANASPFPRAGVAALSIAAATVLGRRPSVERTGGGWLMFNDHIRAEVDDRGLIVSLRAGVDGRECIADGGCGNLLQLHRDLPNEWDAWDIDGFYRGTVTDLVELDACVDESDAEFAALRITRRFGASSVEQRLSLERDSQALRIDTTVDWRESDRLLKLAFEFDVQAETSEAETQFGYVRRPTHANTSWDAARFEIAAHKWIRVGEPDFAVSIANATTYGHDVTRRNRAGDTPTTVVRQSLLRATSFPDPESDRGVHTLTSLVRPDAALGATIEDGYAINHGRRTVVGGADVAPILSSSDPAVVIETVKLADDGSGDVIVRIYESRGRRSTSTIAADFDVEEVSEVDLLERPVAESAVAHRSPRSVTVTLRPFKLATLRFMRPQPAPDTLHAD